jgi:hypothetical protein
VEARLVTTARMANSVAPLIAPLSDPALLARVDAALKVPHGYAARVHAAIDLAASDMLLDAVFAADGLIDRKDLSPWDSALITRNAEHHAPENPLVPLIHTLTRGLAMAAADLVAASLDPEQAATVRRLCAEDVAA